MKKEKKKIRKKESFDDFFKKSKKYWKNRLNYGYFHIMQEFPLLFQIHTLYGKKTKAFNNPKSVLIVNVSLIGDFIHSLPAIRYFTEKHKEAEIDLLVAPLLLPLCQKMKGFRTITSMKSMFQKSKGEKIPFDVLKKEYDLVLLVRIPKKIIKLLEKIEFRTIRTYLSSFIKIGTNVAANFMGAEELKQFRKVNFEIIGENDLNNKNISVDELFEFTNEEIEEIKNNEALRQTEGTKRIAIHTGSGWEIKFWKNDKWTELIQQISELGDFSFIFIGANDQEELSFNYIESNCSVKLHSVIKQLSLKDSLLFLQQCDYFIGVDSGPRHLAHLLNIPSISLLGPGPKTFEPLNNKGVVVDKTGNCYCTNLVCFVTPSCMDNIQVEDVMEAIKKNWILTE